METHQGRSRVRATTRRRWRDDDDAQDRAEIGRTATGSVGCARGVDEVPDRARLGDRRLSRIGVPC